MLFASKCCDYNAKLSRWHSHGANEKSEQVFSNQALNTLFNYGVRTVYSLNSAFFSDWPSIKINQNHKLLPLDARVISSNCDIWITDPTLC
jgi:putative DNA methylase